MKKIAAALTGSYGTPVAAPEVARPQFGLVGWLEETRVHLPLRGVECRFEICGDIAEVKIAQIFVQANTKPLNCTYTFPLPGNAAVYSCEIKIGARIIRAKVEEQQKARSIYEQQVKAGHRASLVEVERDNLFTLSLGNIQPKDIIEVRLAYFQTLDRVGKQLSLMVPFCPGVRYIPGFPLGRTPRGQGTVLDTDQVPDASRNTPPRIPAEHEDAAYVNIEGVITGAEVDLGTVTSPMHHLIAETGRNGLAVRIDMQSGAVPDRDFVLRWEQRESGETTAHSWVYQEPGTEYAVVQLKAPEKVRVEKELPQDYYFLVDRSGSMQGEKWHKTAEALVAFVRRLGAEGRVWVTLFTDNYKDFSPQPRNAQELLTDKAFARIESIGTGGGTEMLPALEHALKMIEKHSFAEERSANLILITDGQVGNEDSIQKALQTYPQVPLFAFGIDTTVNDAFLRNLTRQQHGDVVFQTPRDDIEKAVEALGTKLRRPVVTQIQVGKGWDVANGGLPNLYQGSVIDVALRSPTLGVPLVMNGCLPDGTEYQFKFQRHATASAAVKLLWMKHRITWLLDNMRQAEAIQLALQHNLLCRGTSFIAWDETEKVAVAGMDVYQPSMEVHYAESKGLMSACVGNSRRSYSGVADRLIAKMVIPSDELFGKWGPPIARQVLRLPKAISDIRQLRIFQTPAGKKFLAGLEKWASSEPSKEKDRRRALKKLVTDILRGAQDKDLIRQLCQKFISREVTRISYDERVEQLAAELKKAGCDADGCESLCTHFLKELRVHPGYQLYNLARQL